MSDEACITNKIRDLLHRIESGEVVAGMLINRDDLNLLDYIGCKYSRLEGVEKFLRDKLYEIESMVDIKLWPKAFDDSNCDQDAFRKQMFGEFKPDERAIALHDRLQKYYDDTPDCMHNAKARPIWKDFVRWCGERGYTQEDINLAKRGKFEMNRCIAK